LWTLATSGFDWCSEAYKAPGPNKKGSRKDLNDEDGADKQPPTKKTRTQPTRKSTRGRGRGAGRSVSVGHQCNTITLEAKKGKGYYASHTDLQAISADLLRNAMDSEGRTSHVFKVTAVGQGLDGKAMAVKLGRCLWERPVWWDPSLHGDFEKMVRQTPKNFREEVKKYGRLESLQGTVIPHICTSQVCYSDLNCLQSISLQTEVACSMLEGRIFFWNMSGLRSNQQIPPKG
jgi:hypothetical protein